MYIQTNIHTNRSEINRILYPNPFKKLNHDPIHGLGSKLSLRWREVDPIEKLKRREGSFSCPVDGTMFACRDCSDPRACS